MIAFSCKRSVYPLVLGLALQLGTPSLWAAEPSTLSSQPASPLATRQEYQTQFERRDWAAAAATGQKLVDAARLKAKADPLGLVDALLLLGKAEIGSKNMIAAEVHYSEALELVEGQVGPTSNRLLEPLSGLGYALAEQGKHTQAVSLLERALVVSRRNYGLFDPRQQALLRNLADSESSLGRFTEGERHMRYTLNIGERSFGRDDVRMVPLICNVGDWYVSNGFAQAGRDQYRNALEIIESKLGKNSLAAVEPLRFLARSYVKELQLADYGPKIEDRDRDRDRQNNGFNNDPRPSDIRPINPRYLNPESDRALVRALKILDSNADRSSQVLVETLIQTGDVLQLRSMFDQALPYYRRAALLLTAELKAQPGDATPLSFPVQIYYPVPLLATRNLARPPEEVVDRFVETAFTVTAQGTVKDLRVNSQDATPRQISEASDSIRLARYRPKFVNGEPVDTSDLMYRQVFKQRKEAE